MLSLQATLNLNNRAVELFHSNHIPEAANTYYQSLRFVKQLVRCPEANLNPSPTNVNDATTYALPQRSCCDSPKSRNMHIQQSTMLFLYQNALILQELSESSSHNVLQTMYMYCAVIYFNAGLLHHQHYIKSGNSVHMKQAQHLYESSLKLLVGLPTSNDTVALLVVANYNNLAQIELEKGLVTEASHKLRYLSRLFHRSMPRFSRIFAADEFQGFLYNTLLEQGIISSPAA